MRYIECDICEQRTAPDADLIAMTVPGSWIGQEDESLDVDVCSPACLAQVVQVLTKGEQPEDESESEPESVAVSDGAQIGGQIGGMPNPYRTIRLTPDQSSDITGVKRKGLGE